MSILPRYLVINKSDLPQFFLQHFIRLEKNFFYFSTGYQRASFSWKIKILRRKSFRTFCPFKIDLKQNKETSKKKQSD